ncbi:hypothetical protein ACFVGN_07060 [Streptomyces sp. NPDC057757]|uniref:hypothetical protein n=1 Tax=Streptomyces sp. NPDC057757 TaxID=3346241 RepID=UPI0036C2F5BD
MHTTYEHAEVPAWPVYALAVHDDGRVDVSGPLVPAAGHPNRASAVATVAEAAARLRRPVRAEATEPDGTVWLLVISPDGAVAELPGGGQRVKATRKRQEKAAARAADTAPEPVGSPFPAADEDEADDMGVDVDVVVGTASEAGSAGRPGTAVLGRTGPGTRVVAARHLGPAAASNRSVPEAAPAGRGTEADPEPGGVTDAARDLATALGTDSGSDPAEYAGALALVTKLLQTGRVAKAAGLAARLDEQAAGTLGVSHPDALRIREIRARVTALSGDALAGVHLFRDVAERWHYQGNGERAEAAAVRAQALWMEITELDPALSAGIAVVRLRNQIPGEDGSALTAALKHRAWLESSHAAGGQQPPAPTAAASPGAARKRRPMPSWDRPAQESRTAT